MLISDEDREIKAGAWSKFTQTAKLSIGPIENFLPGPMGLLLDLDGEWITGLHCEMGFTSRNVEKGIEARPWCSSLPLVDHLDGESAAFYELAYALAIEQVADVPVSPREQGIRIIFSELTRIQLHLKYLAKVARSVGAGASEHYLLRDRDAILELFELLAGVRFCPGYIIPGGVKWDVTEGFLERVLDATESLRVRIREIQEMFIFNDIFQERARGVAVLLKEVARKYGVTGPNLRASGAGFDVRQKTPYSGYEQIDFNKEGLEALFGDSLDRVFYRTYEMSQSANIMRQVVEKMSQFDGFSSKLWTREFQIPAGQGFAHVESSRGVLGCSLISDGGSRPIRVHFSTPSRAVITGLPEIIVGTSLEDLPLAIASLDISVMEVDK